MAEKRSGSLPVMGKGSREGFGTMVPCHAETGSPSGTEDDNMKYSEIHHYMFASMPSVGSVGWDGVNNL